MSVETRRWPIEKSWAKTNFTVFVLSLAISVNGAEIQFNRDVRPILSDRCFSCHGPDQANRKTKMRLDVESFAKANLGKGKSAIVPGNTAASEIFKRITSTNATLRMPPAYLGHQRMPDGEIEVIRQWIEQGAKYEQHWSFIAPRKASLPKVTQHSWMKNPIDAFVLSRLEHEGLKPSPEADRRTLIRRLTFDLTGLPPRPADVEAFVTDTASDAYERVVDRLLSSSQYAERMAIRWMEAARYADTNGYQTDGPRTMWRWRDWVINAFAQDMPFDQFTIEQIAGDLLPNPTLAQQIATGFNRNHRTSAEGGSINEELRVEYVADRTETTSTIWLGLTVGCARCHDHKFDPISQKDYYSLFAFFNNVPERGFAYDYGNDKPLIMAPLADQQRKMDELKSEIEAAEAVVESKQEKIAKLQKQWERKLAAGKSSSDWEVASGLAVHFPEQYTFNGQNIVTADKTPKLDYQDPFTFSAWIEPTEATGAILSRGEDFAESEQHGLYLMKGKLRLHITHRWTDLAMRLETKQPLELNRWQHVAVSYDGKMEAAGVHVYVNGKERDVDVLFDQLLAPIKTEAPWRLGTGGGLRFRGKIEDAHVYTRALSENEIAALSVKDNLAALTVIPKQGRTVAQQAKLRLAFLDKAASLDIRNASEKLSEAKRALEDFIKNVPTTMVMKENDSLRDTFILRRGAYDAHGDKVEAAVPMFLPQLPSGPRNRLALARWLVNPKNPLTARAIVNRWWAMLFGTGLVKTVDDFGAQGEWPTHPELLDWLAVDFMESGWRVKHILKTIVTSATYRQSSNVTPELLQRDPENRLLARASRFRLPAEMIRDSALFASDLLVEKIGGPPVRPYQPAGLWQELQGGKGYTEDSGEGLYRRSIYTYWRRTIAPPNMVNFDAPTRETCVVREVRTNTPLQALNLMNDVAYVEAARKLGERMLLHGGMSEESRIDYGIQLVLARKSSEQEQRTLLAALQKFRQHYNAQPKEADSLIAQGRSEAHPRLSHSELAAYTLLGSLLFNLDEAITRE